MILLILLQKYKLNARGCNYAKMNHLFLWPGEKPERNGKNVSIPIKNPKE
jgi:hypothetical protein